MGRFYFHVRAGDGLTRDEDNATARHEAILAAREILAEAIKDGKPNVADAFVIMDEAGRTVDIVPLAAVLPEHMKK